MIYHFTSQDIEKWKQNNFINPITGYRINPYAKSGIVKQLSNAIKNQEKIDENKKCQQLPLEIVHHILKLQYEHEKYPKEENKRKKAETIVKTFFSCETCEDIDEKEELQFFVIEPLPGFLLHKKQNSNISCINDSFKFDYDNTFFLLCQPVDNYQKLLLETRIICKKMQHIHNTNNIKNKDYQYTKKYNISPSFWYNLNIFLNIIITIENNDIKMSIDYYLGPQDIKKIRKKGINTDNLSQDLQNNENHPLLQIFRENISIFYHIIPYMLHQNFINTIKQMQKKYYFMHIHYHYLENSEQMSQEHSEFMQHYHKNIHTLYDFIQNKKDILSWNIVYHNNSILSLKFGEKNYDICKKRLQTLLSGSFHNTIFKY